MLIKFITIIIIIISAVCLSKCCKYSWFIVLIRFLWTKREQLFLLVQLPVKGGGGKSKHRKLWEVSDFKAVACMFTTTSQI